MAKIVPLITFLVVASILLLSVRGRSGNPSVLELSSDPGWTEAGPFELSVERGRFTLTYSLIEDKSFYFSLPLARFATPDLGFSNGNFVSLFAPGLSFIAAPGYLIGKYFSHAQVGTFLTISLFALLNSILIYMVSRKLRANQSASLVASLIFLFCTPAYAYAVSFYQHHVSTFLILCSIYLLFGRINLIKFSLISFFAACSIPIDYPNLFLMAPIGIYSLSKLVLVKDLQNKVSLKINLLATLGALFILIPLGFFFWFNQQSYGNPFQLSGTVAQVRSIDEKGNPVAPQQATSAEVVEAVDKNQPKKSAVNFFKTRNLLNGLYIHLFSPDRGVFHYASAILLGIFGAVHLYKRNESVFPVLIGIIGMNMILYSLWGDPWGGWAFGSRYLIPAYGIMSILLAVGISKLKKNLVFVLLLISLSGYSLYVNTLGAITSSRNPPQVEILALEKVTGREEKYTWSRNLQLLENNQVKSLFYNSFAKNYLSPIQFHYLLISVLGVVMLFLICRSSLSKEND